MYTSQVMRVFQILPAVDRDADGVGWRTETVFGDWRRAGAAGAVGLRRFWRFLGWMRCAWRCGPRSGSGWRLRWLSISWTAGAYGGGRGTPATVGGECAGGMLECDDDDVVLVHDAVRLPIDTATIEWTIDAVAKHGAAIVGLPGSGYDQTGGADGGWSDCDGDDSAGEDCAGTDSPGGAVRVAAAGVCGSGDLTGLRGPTKRVC